MGKRIVILCIAWLIVVLFAGATLVPAAELVANPGMETGNTSGWAVNGAGSIAVSTAQKHSGAYSLYSTGRTATWNGPLQNITSKVQSGKTYTCSGWVRLDNTASASIILTIKKVDGSGTTYTNIASKTGSNSSWTQLSGSFTLSVSGTLTELSIYFEGPGSGINYYLDDVSVSDGGPVTPTPTPVRTATPQSGTPTPTASPVVTPTPTASPGVTPTPNPANLMTNPGLETGNISGWTVNGAGAISVSTTQKHSGTYSLYHTGRTATWNGPLQNITSKVQSGKTYNCSGWMRLDNTASASMTMTIKKVDGSGTTYANIATVTGNNSSWVQLSGTFTLSVSGTLNELSIYFEGPGSGINYYLDDVSVTTTTASVTPTPSTTKKFHCFLLLGQSNMAGFALAQSADKVEDSRVLVLGYDNNSALGRVTDQWDVACPPLHAAWLDAIGPGDWFGKTIVSKIPAGDTIGLIPCAISGEKIETFMKVGGSKYSWIIRRAQLAQQAGGVIEGILFHQGESNNGDTAWTGKVKQLVTDLRTDLGLGNVPFLAGELLYTGSCAGMNTYVNQLPSLITNCYVVSANGLVVDPTDTTYRLHFGHDSVVEFGKRYANIMIQALHW